MGYWYTPKEMRNQRFDLQMNTRAQRMRVKPSPIERPVRCTLEALKLPFISQKIMGTYIADFYLPDHKTVIECDGFAYHQNIEREERRDRYFVTNGYRVLHIPGWLCKQPAPLSGFIRDFVSAGDSAPISHPKGELDTVTSQTV